MTRLFKSFRLMVLLLLARGVPAMAQTEITKEGVSIFVEQNADETILVKSAKNDTANDVYLIIDGQDPLLIDGRAINIAAKSSVYYSRNRDGSNGFPMWTRLLTTQEESAQADPVQEDSTGVLVQDPAAKPSSPASTLSTPQKTSANLRTKKKMYVSETIHTDEYFGQDAVSAFEAKCSSYLNALTASENKHQFIIDHDLHAFIEQSEAEIDQKRKNLPDLARELVAASATENLYSNLVQEILESRLNARSNACNQLKIAVQNAESPDRPVFRIDREQLVNYGLIGCFIFFLLLGIVFLLARKKKAKPSPFHDHEGSRTSSASSVEDANAQIVVRRKTTSILKEQNLDDVKDNPAYYVINTFDFSHDSAVRKIYVKNTCIKEIYKMYENDLRSSENPKEDGCMVLGRWVYDSESQTYDVSMEYVVMPGDDAVFKEYELNFGGKIKLRAIEKLRKLRRETNLQYDLVCWIHSHPGLGVFFSNSDDNVQMQMKHVQHPNFLVAFVVDILTDGQDLGIFTFRKNGTMNSKNDLTRMYSLEEMYKWALESDKIFFSPENYYNILEKAKVKMHYRNGIELNNSAIIDLVQMIQESETGFVGWAVGTTVDTENGKEFIVSSFACSTERPASGIIGLVLNVSPFSMPTVQRLLAGENSSPAFVLVYSSKQSSLTSIPIINGEVITDEQFYGNETIDNLKIWTRRKR